VAVDYRVDTEETGKIDRLNRVKGLKNQGKGGEEFQATGTSQGQPIGIKGDYSKKD